MQRWTYNAASINRRKKINYKLFVNRGRVAKEYKVVGPILRDILPIIKISIIKIPINNTYNKNIVLDMQGQYFQTLLNDEVDSFDKVSLPVRRKRQIERFTFVGVQR